MKSIAMLPAELEDIGQKSSTYTPVCSSLDAPGLEPGQQDQPRRVIQMIGRRAVIGLSLLSALAFSAVAATGAMAETKTATAFTCVKNAEPGGAGFSKEHCAEGDAVASGAQFKHVEIPVGKGTLIQATNEKTGSETTAPTNAAMNATVGGLKATVTCKKVTVTGEIENFEDPVTKAMDIKGRKGVIKGTECVLSGALATIEGCKVVKGEIQTNELSGTSLVNTMEGESTGPGGVFATISLEGCKTKELNEKGITVSGSSRAIADGATGETTVASTSGLKAAGQAASLTSKVTARMISDKGVLESPVSGTTIIDP